MNPHAFFPVAASSATTPSGDSVTKIRFEANIGEASRYSPAISVPVRPHFTTEKKTQSALFSIEETRSGPTFPRPLSPWQEAQNLPYSRAPFSADSLPTKAFCMAEWGFGRSARPPTYTGLLGRNHLTRLLSGISGRSPDSFASTTRARQATPSETLTASAPAPPAATAKTRPISPKRRAVFTPSDPFTW